MKLYTFLNAAGEVIEQVRAASHDEAVCRASNAVTPFTDFYSEKI